MAAIHTTERDGERDVNDQYETPDDVLLALYLSMQGALDEAPVWDPACGTGRIARFFKSRNPEGMYPLTDIQYGDDFLDDEISLGPEWEGHIVTNPPYRDRLAEAFVRQALRITRGYVCMLLNSDFLWSNNRRDWLANSNMTSALIVPWRIRFLRADGTPIKSQAYSHFWAIWPPRREASFDYTPPQVVWAHKQEVYTRLLAEGK